MEIHKKDIVYYARILPSVGIYEVCELSVRTVTDDYFVGTDKRDKHAYLIYLKHLNETVFFDRESALRKVTEVEENKIEFISDEYYYEEY